MESNTECAQKYALGITNSQRKWLILGAVLAACLASSGLASSASAENLQLNLTSRQSLLSGNAPANDYAVSQVMSANGRYVVFISNATNLEGGPSYSLYLRDTSTGTTELVSRSDGSSGPFTSAAYPGGVSDDGRFVSFKAYDNENVLDEDAVLGFDPGLNGGNIYVRDTVLNETSLVSRASGCNGAGANGLSFGDSISANGRFVAFNSASSNLSSSATAMTDGGWPVIQTYVRDLWFNTTTLVSRRSAIHGDGPANGWGSTGVTSISNSGRRVGFSTDATNLDSQGTGGSFVRDLDFHTTKRIAPYAAIYEQAAPIISGDGYHALYVLGETYERNLWTGNVELVSRATGAGPNEGSAGYSSGHAISGDGRYVAFSSDSAILNTSGDPTIHQVYVRDLYAGTTTLVSRRAGSEVVAGDDWSDYPTISDNGQYVGFNTWAPNLLDDDLDVNNMWRSVQAKVTYP